MIGQLLEDQRRMASLTNSLVVILVGVAQDWVVEAQCGYVQILNNLQLVGSDIAVGTGCFVVACLAAAVA